MGEYGSVHREPADWPWGGAAAAREGDYLAYRSVDGLCYIATDLNGILPCQFIRRRLAQFWGLKEWNWESALREISAQSSATPRLLPETATEIPLLASRP